MNPDIKPPATEVGVDPAQAALAGRLAKDVVDCDTSILSLIVVDALGRVLHVSRSARLPESEHVDPGLVQMFGTIAKTIMGAANNATPVMGRTEAIVGVFKKQKVLLINLQEYNLLLALRLSRSANAEYVCDKIGDLLAARGER
jgi:hypothetical protein